MGITIVAIVGGLLLYALTSIAVVQPGRALQAKFVSLGTIAGRTKDEIIAAVGPPNAISASGEGVTVLQWMATGYHIALIFDGDTCRGVSHEFAN